MIRTQWFASFEISQGYRELSDKVSRHFFREVRSRLTYRWEGIVNYRPLRTLDSNCLFSYRWVLLTLDFPGGSVVKNLSTNAGDLGSIPESRRSPEAGMATHSSILAWEIPWTENLVGYSPWGLKRVGHNLEAKQYYSSCFSHEKTGSQRIYMTCPRSHCF